MSDLSALSGTFDCVASLTRYGAIVRPPVNLRISYECDPDGERVEYVSAQSDDGESRDPYDVHPTTLEDAFRMHWASRQRLAEIGFTIDTDGAKRIANGVECWLTKLRSPGVPRLSDPVRVRMRCSKAVAMAQELEPGLAKTVLEGMVLRFEELEHFLQHLLLDADSGSCA